MNEFPTMLMRLATFFALMAIVCALVGIGRTLGRIADNQPPTELRMSE